MLPALNNGQLKKLKDVLEVNLYNVAIVTRKDEENEPETQDYLEIFLSAKRIEGCSEKTLTYYRNTIHQIWKVSEKRYAQLNRRSSNISIEIPGWKGIE